MIICCIGDSLTEGDYGVKNTRGVPNVQARNYPFFLSEMTGAQVRNYGRCGWRSSDMLAWYEAGGIDLDGADAVILMLGTNGGQCADGDSEENDAYLRLVSHIREDHPDARLFLATPPNVTENPAYSNCGYGPQVREAVGFVRRTAKALSLPLVDLAASTRITHETEDVLQANDGLHFVEEGYRVLAEEILSALQMA